MPEADATTLRGLLRGRAERPALVVPDRAGAISYGELDRAIDDAAARLRGLGVRAGDRVAICFGNGPEVVALFLAIASCGAAAAPLNPALGPRELRGEIEDLAVGWVLHDATSTEKLAEAAAGTDVRLHAAMYAAGGIEIDGAPSATPDAGDEASIALLLHTSGTTSRPKTVPLRQRNLVASARTVGESYDLSPADVSLCVMPLFHVHGLVASVLATFATGGTVVVPPRFSASSFWDDVRTYGATWYSAVPTIHAIALQKAREHAGSFEHGLRFVRSCSAPLPPATWEAFEATVRVPFVEAYGMTEAAHQMATNPLPPRERRAGTVGVATGVEVAALDDGWRPVPAGERGEVSVRGVSVVDGYLDNPEANASSFRDGWFRTGDVGTITTDGYVTLVGRIKELINRGGEKISPYEVEAVLLMHPAVREAAAYPVPDEKYGEQVGVVVVVDGPVDSAELTRHCEAHLVAFKIPAKLSVLPEIPKGPTGKVQRRNLASLVDG